MFMNIPTEENNTEVDSTPEVSQNRLGFLKKIDLKVLLIIVVVLAAICLIYIARSLFVAATVDGSPIGRIGVIHRLERSQGKEVIDALVNKKLIDNEAHKNNVHISDEDINAEVKKIEDTIVSQGSTLEEALKMEKLTLKELKEQILVQEQAEALLADKIKVEDAEVDSYIAESGTPAPAGQEAEYKEQVREQLRSQKLGQEFGILIDKLRKDAKIRYYVNY